MEKIILVGYGGHAKSIADCIERGNKYEIIGYTAPKEQESPYRYLGADDVLWTYCDKGIQNAIVCIGYLGKGDVRDRLYRQLKEIGFRLPIIVDPSAVISKSAHIGEGTFIGKGAVINADAVIGKMAIINTHAVVEHDCKIGDYVHVAVGAVLCGMVNVGDKSLIGANATIIQTIHIGNNCIIGAGSLVIRIWVPEKCVKIICIDLNI